MTKDRLNILSVLFLVVLFCSTVYASPVITVDSAFTTSAEAVANMTGCDNQFPVVNTFSWNAPVTFLSGILVGLRVLYLMLTGTQMETLYLVIPMKYKMQAAVSGHRGLTSAKCREPVKSLQAIMKSSCLCLILA